MPREAPETPATPLRPARLRPLAVCVGVGLSIWLLPRPDGVTADAWRLLAIFVATVVGFVARPLPMGAIALIGITATVCSGTLEIGPALSGFANPTIWLIAVAFFVARAFIKSGLGERIAYLFMRRFGKTTLGLAYGMAATDLVLAPAVLSNTARAGAIIGPLLHSVARVFGSEPRGGSARRIGAFLFCTAFQVNVVTSAMFMTAMGANPLVGRWAGEAGVEVTWTTWFVGALVPGVLSLVAVPAVIYRIYPPEIHETPAARELAAEKLRNLGPVTASEWTTLGVFAVLLTLWVFGSALGIHGTTTGLIGLIVLLLTGVLTWDDILAERHAWDTIVWFAALVMMATQLSELGFIPWFGDAVGQHVAGMGWVGAFLVLSLVYFYSHYFFASQTAHISAMYVPFLAVALAVGTPPLLAALVLAYFSNLFSSLTHYANGPAPVLFGGGYVQMGAWWRVGALISVLNIAIWIGAGAVWWWLIGWL